MHETRPFWFSLPLRIVGYRYLRVCTLLWNYTFTSGFPAIAIYTSSKYSLPQKLCRTSINHSIKMLSLVNHAMVHSLLVVCWWCYLGLLYLQFYQNADMETLRQLYISIVTTPRGVCSTSREPKLEENTQEFMCKVVTKNWDKGYDELLNMTNLPSLADRRLYLKLTLYLVHNCAPIVLFSR